MTRAEFRSRFEPVVRLFGRTFDVADWTVYYQALADIPLPLFDDAITRLAQEDRAFLPRPGELRALAETSRRARLALHPWRPCALCEPLHGFVAIVDASGVTRLQPCACHEAHRRSLLDAGVPSMPLLLEAAPRVDEAEYWDAVKTRPDLSQLPADIAHDVKVVALQKRMPRGEQHPEKRERAHAWNQIDPDGRPLPPWMTR